MTETTLTIVTFVTFQNLIFESFEATTETHKDIKQLEEDKAVLFKQINEAIADSVNSLKNSNDTESKLGVQFMSELKAHVSEINKADFKIPDEEINNTTYNVTDGRRNRQKIPLTLEELKSLFKKKRTSMAPDDLKHHADTMALTVDQWLQQKRLEKERIKAYKKNMYSRANEKCPRIGKGKKTIRVNGSKRNVYYPCCRKCCKKSYMGCL